MNANEELIQKFYTSFQNKDYKTMQSCYADNATFSDAVFTDLNSKEVKAMWEMLCLRGKDLQLEFKNIVADEKNGSAEWKASYTFSVSGNKVVNNITSNFVFENGKIIQHIDSFNFYAWAKQALGFKGFLLGKTAFFKNKVRKNARENLMKFMQKN